jgi:hypothetical protein
VHWLRRGAFAVGKQPRGEGRGIGFVLPERLVDAENAVVVDESANFVHAPVKSCTAARSSLEMISCT